MAPITNARVLFNEVPLEFPIPGRTTLYDESETIDLDAELPPESVLVKIKCMSVDPYMRGKMRAAGVESYSVAFVLGKPMENSGMGKIIKSTHKQLEVGTYVYGFFPFQQYVIVQNPFIGVGGLVPRVNKENLPWTVYLGAMGMSGRTAYHGWREFTRAKKGEVVFVSTGGGPVGSFVIQLAKRDGLKVIASAGSEDKVEFMKMCGADVVFNYKTTSTAAVLQREGPIDIFWDNVGGEILDIALCNASQFARFVECGMISGYNTAKPYAFKNMMEIVGRRIQLFGFLVGDLEHKYNEEFYEVVPKWIAEGGFKYVEEVVWGLEGAGKAVEDVQRGRNRGKSVVMVDLEGEIEAKRAEASVRTKM